MPIPQGFQHAKLEIDGQPPIECAFNPQMYTIVKTNVWTFKPRTGVDLPDGEFGGGNPRLIKLSLLLDVSLLGPDQSIREVSDRLFKMMETGGGGGGGGGVPPFVTFTWGSVNTFKAVATSLSVQFLLFHPNGEPIRADVGLELAQADKASTASASSAGEPQNPTTRAMRGLRIHSVKDGDSLAGIAYDAYGDPNRWRVIAEANGIDDPLRLRRGTPLTIPTLET
jgi:Contractile injection system tube protein/LysM domain